jgi:hypothetical protein
MAIKPIDRQHVHASCGQIFRGLMLEALCKFGGNGSNIVLRLHKYVYRVTDHSLQTVRLYAA